MAILTAILAGLKSFGSAAFAVSVAIPGQLVEVPLRVVAPGAWSKPTMEVSTMDILGRVAKRCKTNPITGCVEWQGPKDKDGYGKIEIMRAGKIQYWRTHRLVFTLRFGSIPAGRMICHHCDNPSCCNPDHLYCGDAKTNQQDCLRRGRSRPARGDRNGTRTHPERVARGNRNGSRLQPERLPRGSKHKNARLTEEQVREIRARYQPCVYDSTMIAADYGVCSATIGYILRGKTWRHVT